MASVTVSKDTLGDSSITFVRDVLRHHLTDKQSPARTASNWIFKSRPEERELDPPIVIVDHASEEMVAINPYKQFAPAINLNVVIWARHIDHRDEIADEVVKILKDRTSHDTDTSGHSLWSNHLIFKRATKSNEDGIIDGFPKVMRIKRVLVTFKYNGG